MSNIILITFVTKDLGFRGLIRYVKSICPQCYHNYSFWGDNNTIIQNSFTVKESSNHPFHNYVMVYI